MGSGDMKYVSGFGSCSWAVNVCKGMFTRMRNRKTSPLGGRHSDISKYSGVSQADRYETGTGTRRKD